ncbi:MAG: hypothetical protein ABEJ93_00230 [Candidatus Nanohalobium sp.]
MKAEEIKQKIFQYRYEIVAGPSLFLAVQMFSPAVFEAFYGSRGAGLPLAFLNIGSGGTAFSPAALIVDIAALTGIGSLTTLLYRRRFS